MTDAPEREEQAAAEVRAKALPLRLPIAVEPPALVPARMINETLYCERLMYLEWVQGEWADNAFTVDGRAVHTRADSPGGALPPVPPATPNTNETASGDEDDAPDADELLPYRVRSLWLSSEELGMTAKIDVVEGEASGVVVPIEYKRSAAPDVPGGAYLPERAQICAQVLLLRAQGYTCDYGEIYFARTKRRVRIDIDDALIATTREAVRRAKELTASGVMPPPLVDSPRCVGCSLVGICLPDETNLLRGHEPSADADRGPPDERDPMAEFWPVPEDLGSGTEIELRRLQPARDDHLPLYVQEQGARVSLSGEELVIKGKEQETRARLPNVSQVNLFGNVQMTTQALRETLDRGLSVSLFSSGGWFYGRATGFTSKNVELRVAQYRTMADNDACVRLARGVVASKIRNSRTLIRRNHADPPEVTLFELEQLAKKAEGAASLATLLGIEGTAARSYFGVFAGMFKGPALGSFDLDGRNRRPPRDPINALLSLAYSLLTKELAQTIASAGLDPLLGFYHQPRFGRPALALDLMEEFRPLIADSTVLSAVNNAVVGPSDFLVHPTGVSLRPHGRKRFLLAYERRMDQLVTHPVFGYRVSYRRVLEVQTRLLGRFLLGEIPHYPEFRTR